MSEGKDGEAASRRTTGPRRNRAVLSRRNLPLLMLTVREHVTGYFRPLFREFGLTEQQWRILRAVYEGGELLIGQIAERCYILGPSLTGILQRMIDGGIIVKRLDPDDTRRFYVSATKHGMSLFERMAPRVEQEYGRLEQHIGADKVATLYEILDVVLKNMTESTAEDRIRADDAEKE